MATVPGVRLYAPGVTRTSDRGTAGEDRVEAGATTGLVVGPAEQRMAVQPVGTRGAIGS
ncbi:MAG TPA: hypothetical protein VKF37_10605 [Chloroflexota bacterium]|nr:hypothetical protein [Chloroflexota bacterium]